MPETIPESTVVRVTNTAGAKFVGKYANNRYVIEPGQTAIVPYYAAVLWFGDPRATNVGDARLTQYRAHEVDRLSAKYGLIGAPFYSDQDTVTTTVDGEKVELRYVDARHPNLPRCTVETVDGDRLITVIDDPAGDHLTAQPQTVKQARATEDAVQGLQRQMQVLMAELARSNPEAAARLQAGITPPDAPDAPATPDHEVMASLDAALTDDQITGAAADAVTDQVTLEDTDELIDDGGLDLDDPKPDPKVKPSVNDGRPTRSKKRESTS